MTADANQDVSGIYVKVLMTRLINALSEGGVRRVLRTAGETRTLKQLTNGSSWSSYSQFRALLKAAVQSGGPGVLFDEDPAQAINLDFADAIRSCGSPRGVLLSGTDTNALLPARRYELEEIQECEWIIREWFVDGSDPYPEFCNFVASQYRVIPLYFGLRHAEVHEEQCQCKGDDACVFRLRWEPNSSDAEQPRVEDLIVQIHLLNARLEQLQSMVTDLASNERYEDILQGIVRSSMSAVGAAGAILVVDAYNEFHRRVYAEGMSAVSADLMAGALFERGIDTAQGIAIEVASARRRYGVLAIDERGGVFTSQSRSTLETYGGLAAAALDSVDAREEARHQAATAQTLLALSEALAELVSTEEMADRIAEAVPMLIDCDRVGVFLSEPDPAEGSDAGQRLVGSHGYPVEAEELLRSTLIEDGVRTADWISADGLVSSSVSEVGTIASVSAPITSGGVVIGYVVVGVTDRPERLTITPRLSERLKGLAAQASIAISNANLLDQIRYQALHDPLTGLPNRSLILDRAEQMLARARRSYLPVAALFIDLDGFKDVNDRLGHGAGDRLLRAVTARLAATMRESDSIGRLGGDEFVILVDGSNMDVGPELVAERVLEVLREPFTIEGTEFSSLNLTASIGIAVGSRASANDLLQDADTALYEAKRGGKNRYVIFEPAMHTAIQDRLVLNMDLRDALASQQYFLVYQPIFDLRSGRTIGVEALLRWRHPERGVLPPDTFIPILEGSDMMDDVGCWVLAEACRQGVIWHIAGYRLAVSVNVSARQLESDHFTRDVERILSETGFDPAFLMLEITESTIMRNVDAVKPTLAALKAIGIRLAIDDFGTGYSSLSYLQQFPVDTIKIDRSFISAMGETAQSNALVRTLIQLGKALGMETLAEGIEHSHQYAQLKDLACDSGQGFLMARPLESEAIEKFLAASPAKFPEALRGS